ncbi:MAG: LysR substrate-binding domain-containing protein [Woeseiaceae bacterium]|nr:LysR substrate-binding domain-containing protein [Woeseiaceae bacterium]
MQPEDIAELPLLQPRIPGKRLGKAGLPAAGPGRCGSRSPGMLCQQFSLVIQAAVASVGVALLPRFLIRGELERGELVALLDKPYATKMAYYLVTPANRIDYPPVVAFREWLLALISRETGHAAVPGRRRLTGAGARSSPHFANCRVEVSLSPNTVRIRRVVIAESPMIARRTRTSWWVAALFAGGRRVRPRRAPRGRRLAERLRALEEGVGGRLGVHLLDTATPGGRRAALRRALHDAERVQACSPSALVLDRVDRDEESLERRIQYGADDLVSWSPVARGNSGEGVICLGELCEATITTSDNAAANLILASYGGPAGRHRRMRAASADTVHAPRSAKSRT